MHQLPSNLRQREGLGAPNQRPRVNQTRSECVVDVTGSCGGRTLPLLVLVLVLVLARVLLEALFLRAEPDCAPALLRALLPRHVGVEGAPVLLADPLPYSLL